MNKTYDVALSFAGEDRAYVDMVAKCLKGQVEVFYDKFEETDLWGKNLHEHFSEVYSSGTTYVVMFISEHYRDKMWAKLERRVALTAAMGRDHEYVLPVRFDDTELVGLLPSIAYLNLSSISPEELCNQICQKVGKKNTASAQIKELKDQSPLARFVRSRDRFLTKEAACLLAGCDIIISDLTGASQGILTDIEEKIRAGEIEPINAKDGNIFVPLSQPELMVERVTKRRVGRRLYSALKISKEDLRILAEQYEAIIPGLH